MIVFKTIYKGSSPFSLEKKYIYIKMLKRSHLFHIVDPSPWPLLASLSLLNLVIGATLYFYGKSVGSFIILYSFFFLTFVAILWWRDVIREGTFEGKHTSVVQKGLKLGMILFIASEVMFFVSFFWAFFNFALAPSIHHTDRC